MGVKICQQFLTYKPPTYNPPLAGPTKLVLINPSLINPPAHHKEHGAAAMNNEHDAWGPRYLPSHPWRGEKALGVDPQKMEAGKQ